MSGGRAYREVDSRCWSAAARPRDMDAEGVTAQVLSPIPITLFHGEPVAGATALATAQNDFLAGLVAEAPDRLFALSWSGASTRWASSASRSAPESVIAS